MKDHLGIVLEALRRAQAKVAFYLEPGNGNPEQAFKEIAQILDDRELSISMQELHASLQSPSLSPDFVSEPGGLKSPV